MPKRWLWEINMFATRKILKREVRKLKYFVIIRGWSIPFLNTLSVPVQEF